MPTDTVPALTLTPAAVADLTEAAPLSRDLRVVLPAQ